jgi:hypothetical protein
LNNGDWLNNMIALRKEYEARRDEAQAQIRTWRDTAMHFEGAIAALDTVITRMGTPHVEEEDVRTCGSE